MKTFATDLGFPEAPVWLPDRSLLLVEMSSEKGWIVRIGADGRSRHVVATTGRPNGLALDRHGHLWVAETAMRAVLKMTLDGKHEVLANSYRDEPFLFLNDLAFAPNGDLYVTDSGIAIDEMVPGGQLAPDYRSLQYDGRVFRVDAVSAAVELIDRGLQFSNGLAFGPDGDLYVAETLTGNIYRYASHAGRVTGQRELFGNVLKQYDPMRLQGPDGMKFGLDGRLYVAVFGQGDVTVLNRSGDVACRLATQGDLPTNLTFGPPGYKQIYVTEGTTGTVQILDVDTDGLPLHG